MSFPRYPAYKDSGVEWLGTIPSHWESAPLKRHYQIVGGSTPKSDTPELWDGSVVWVTPADLSRLTSFDISTSQRTITEQGLQSCGTTLVPQGSVILSTRAPIGSLGIAAKELCTNQGCKALVPIGPYSSRFLAYLLSINALELNNRGRGTTFLELSSDELGAFRIPVPPLEEQLNLETFLDHETSKIDALVAEQARLITLLKEKRQAVISHAVTKGLAPSVPMKDSGIEWLGEVPEHWRVSRLQRVVKPGTSVTYGIVQAGPDFEGGIPYIRTSDLSGDELPINGYPKTSPEIDASYGRSKVSAGDLVIAIRATVGKCLPVPSELDGANLTQGTARIAPGPETDPGYLLAYINSNAPQTYFDLMAKGATFREITLEVLRKTPVLLPPIHEQVAVSTWVELQSSKFMDLVHEAERSQALLRERRAALISAAVTGQIDVRELA